MSRLHATCHEHTALCTYAATKGDSLLNVMQLATTVAHVEVQLPRLCELVCMHIYECIGIRLRSLCLHLATNNHTLVHTFGAQNTSNKDVFRRAFAGGAEPDRNHDNAEPSSRRCVVAAGGAVAAAAGLWQ